MKNLILSHRAFATIKQECCSYPLVETGGILVGKYTDPDIIVPFALGSGPAAVRTPCRFKPDVLWQQKRLDQYFEQYGLNYVGSFHRHPGKYSRPSHIDYRTAIDILTDPDWAVDEIVFPIILLEVMTIIIYPYYISRKHLEFEALPLGVMPDDHDLLNHEPKKAIDYENCDLRRSP